MFRQSSLFQFINGDHVCVFYRSVADLMHTLTPYVADGLRRGERCFCAQQPEVLKRLTYDLMYLGIDPEYEIRRGALDLRVDEDLYLSNGRFEPQRIFDLLVRSIHEARAQGFSSFRSAGELSWAVHGAHECDHLIGYEQLVQEYYPGKPAIGLCQYSLEKFAPSILDRVLAAHRMQIAETAANASHASIHIRHPKWSAEVVADKVAREPRYYYVVQNRSPREITGWGVASDFASASSRIDQLSGSPSPSFPITS